MPKNGDNGGQVNNALYFYAAIKKNEKYNLHNLICEIKCTQNCEPMHILFRKHLYIGAARQIYI